MVERSLRDQLHDVAQRDIDELVKKDAEYGNSWKKRGGVGAYMMLARKIDRIEQQVKAHGWDIFTAAATDTRDEGIRDDIGDLRRYLMLVETEISPRVAHPQPTDRAIANSPPYACPDLDQDGWMDERPNGTGQEHPFGYQADDD